MENNPETGWQGTFEVWQNKNFGKIYAEFSNRKIYFLEDIQLFVSSQPIVKNTTIYLYCTPKGGEWLPKLRYLAKRLNVANIWIYSIYSLANLREFLKEEMSTLTIDLESDRGILWKKIGKKTRNMVRKGEKVGVEVKLAESEEEFNAWWNIYCNIADEKKFGKQNYSLVRGLFKEKELSCLFLSMKNGRVVGGSFFLINQYPVYWLGAFDRNLTSGHINIWTALCYFHDNHYKILDLGGVDLQKEDGPTVFKKSFDGEIKKGYIYIVPVNMLKKTFINMLARIKI